ncbi:MAG: hypothetical protein GY920_01760 [Aliivibrio sp.]|nr:hypothetical protein [Aliivibrio sp.]
MNNLFILIRYTLTALLAYSAGFYFSDFFMPETAMIGGLWAVISGFILDEDLNKATLFNTAKNRIVGTGIGSVLSAVYLLYIPFNVLTFTLLIMVCSFVCLLFSYNQYIKLANITIAVVVIVSTVTDANPIMNSFLRFIESTTGVLSGIIASLICFYFFSIKSTR